MEELVQDLVSALEQTSEQARLDELWEEQMWEEQLWEELVLSPLQQRRVVRRRRGRKRRCDSALHGPVAGRWLSEASESSLDEALARGRRSGPAVSLVGGSATVAATNQSDSDEVAMAPVPFRGGQRSWPESDSIAENVVGRPLRRRRRVRRVASEGTMRLQQKLRVSGLERREQTHHHHHPHHHHHHHHHHQRTHRKRRLGRVKRRTGAWPGQDSGPAVGGLAEECWKDKTLRLAKEQKEASDENLSECETSSVCSSDPGLFTTDEGRQGDDEQSDWFFEGECAAGVGAQSVLCGWEAETAPRVAGLGTRREKPPSARFLQPAQPSHRGYHTRANRLPAAAVGCIRSGRRRLPGKDNGMAACVDKMRNYPQDSCQKEFWMPSFGKRDRSQLKPLCPLSVYPAAMVPEASYPRCSSAVCRNRQFHGPLGLQCAGDVKRRRKTLAAAPASLPFRKEFKRETEQGCPRASSTGRDAAVPLSSTSQTHGYIGPGPSHGSYGENEDD
ncbi:G patch domain-containing protein 2-like [Electrophorus electricus]|uniref:G patch domain-containing protein 2-like n=1 Tax=Electrophorus electricus TaxID=8005 RepID=UPI0015D0808F|nr:G patch domain-containing protein 2-like [Electrophorus electricus]XP_026879524.2 G patch domain-containing protein 2-like [Electrophorus electricus]